MIGRVPWLVDVLSLFYVIQNRGLWPCVAGRVLRVLWCNVWYSGLAIKSSCAVIYAMEDSKKACTMLASNLASATATQLVHEWYNNG